MSGPEFFQTRMGQRYYEDTLPRIVVALEKIARGQAPEAPERTSRDALVYAKPGMEPTTEREKEAVATLVVLRSALANAGHLALPDGRGPVGALNRVLDLYGIPRYNQP